MPSSLRAMNGLSGHHQAAIAPGLVRDVHTDVLSASPAGSARAIPLQIAYSICHVFLLQVYFFGLSSFYVKHLVAVYSSSGFIHEYSSEAHFISILLITASGVLTSFQYKPSNIIIHFFVLTLLIPSAVFVTYGDGNPAILYLALLSQILMRLGALGLRSKKLSVVTDFSFAEKYVAGYLIASICYLFFRLGFDQFSFDLATVYDRRAILGRRYDAILAYNFGLMRLVLFGMSICYLHNAKYHKFAILLIASLLLFGATGHKSIFIIQLIMSVLYFGFTLLHKRVFIASSFGVVIFTFIFLNADVVSENILADRDGLIINMIFRRILFIPSMLNHYYVEFFSNTDYLFWAYSKISFGLVSYQEYLDPAKLIGKYIFTDAHANTGLIGSGYMNAGYFGVALYATIIGASLGYVDAIARRDQDVLIPTLLTFPGYLLLFTSSDLPGAFLTHGFGAMLLLLWLIRFGGQGRKEAPDERR